MAKKIGKHFLALLVVVLATAGGVAAADVLNVGGAPEEIAAPDPAPVPGSQAIQAHAADPSGGAPWAVRTYTIGNGQTCADFGRDVNGRLGLVDANGRFHERRPEDAGGNCGDPAAATGLLLAATYYADDPTTDAYEPPRAIVHGVAGPKVESITIHWPDADVAPDVSAHRAFISVDSGGAARVPVTVTYRGGQQSTLDLGLPGGG